MQEMIFANFQTGFWRNGHCEKQTEVAQVREVSATVQEEIRADIVGTLCPEITPRNSIFQNELILRNTAYSTVNNKYFEAEHLQGLCTL